jgi:type IV pilus assembly protein PilO
MSAEKPATSWRERLASPLTWHVAGFAVLLVVTVGLAIRLGMDWAVTNSHSSDVLAGKQIQLKALQIETTPLRGLDERVAKTRDQMLDFYAKRIPPNYSSIDARINQLQVDAGVRLSRVGYAQNPPGAGLVEISMDAGVSGEYPAIMRFINSIERDSTFFIIRNMTLTGQQGGLVNLRMGLSTYLRPADAAASGIPVAPLPGQPGAQEPAGQGAAGQGPISLAPLPQASPAAGKEGE